jgi:hypothetical protein
MPGFPNAGGGGGGISPPAGDLSGTTAAPTVTGIQGKPIVGGPTNGDVLEYNGTDWVPVAPGGTLTSVAGNLAAYYSMTTGLVTFLTTPSLAIGTWVFTFSTLMRVSPSDFVEGIAALGSAVGTLSGCLAFGSYIVAGGSQEIVDASMAFKAVITTAGTLVFQVQDSLATGIVEVSTPAGTFPNVTGYTGIKVA